MKIDEILNEYKKSDNNNLIGYITNIVEGKYDEGQWDKGIDSQSDNLTIMLLYEYSTAIEKLTKGKIQAKQVTDKLTTQMGKLRYGDYKKGVDDMVLYDKHPVTSDEYKNRCRIKGNFGAHAPTYVDSDNKIKSAIVLFDDKQLFNGMALAGIDLSDLSDIRGTIFHEWTHVMEKSIVNAVNIKKDDIIFTKGDSTYINAMVDVDWSMQEFENYISNIDKIVGSNQEVIFNGISTVEINKRKDPNKRIMHNQIGEGATEKIARDVMGVVGDTVKDPSRYYEQVQMINALFNSLGLDNAISTYFTEPQRIVRILEEKEIDGKDALHYVSECVNSSGKSVHDFNVFVQNGINLCAELKNEDPLKNCVTSMKNKNHGFTLKDIGRAVSLNKDNEKEYICTKNF